MADETYRYDVVIGVDVVADKLDAGLKDSEVALSRWERKAIQNIKRVQSQMDLLAKNGFNQKLTQDLSKFILMSEKLNRSYIQTSKARENADSQASRNKQRQNELVQASDLRLNRLQEKNIRDQKKGEESLSNARSRFIQQHISEVEKATQRNVKFNQDRLKASQNYQIGEQRLINQQIQNQLRLEREERRIFNARQAMRNKELRDSERLRDKRIRGSETAGRGMLGAGTAISAAVTAPIVAGLIQTIKIGSQYEQSMNMLQAVTSATAEQMRQADEAAMKLGNDLSLPGISAKDAAEAMTELGKAGLSVEQSIAAANGTLKLSIAANISAAQAAEITSNALNMFSLQASEAGRVADLLAAAANASSAEVTDVADAMKQAGAVFAGAKVPIEDLVTLIAEMAKQGIKGSDAGTSLKTMLLRLQAPTDKAADALKALNIAVYDQQGVMKPMRDIISQFETSLKGLTDQQKAQAFQTIFGQDAIRAANIVFSQGAAGFDKMKEAVMRTNAATELAAARTKGLAGAWDAFTSQLETIGLILYNRIKKPLTEIIMTVATLVQVLTDGFLKLPESIQMVAAAFVAMLAAAGPLIIAFGILLISVSSLVEGLLLLTGAATVGAALATMLPIIVGITAVIAGLVAGILIAVGVISQLRDAWDSGWGEILSVTILIVSGVMAAFAPIIALPTFFATLLYTIYKLWEKNFGGIQDFTISMFERIKKIVNTALEALLKIVNQIGSKILTFWAQNGNQVQSIFTTIYNTLYKIVETFLLNVERIWIKYAPSIISIVSTLWQQVSNIILTAVDLILVGINFTMDLINGNWDRAWVSFLNIIKKAATLLTQVWMLIQNNAMNFLIWLVKNLALYGSKATLGLITAIAKGATWLVTAFINLPQTIISLVPRFLAAGMQIGSAIWQGIQDAMTGNSAASSDLPTVPFDILDFLGFNTVSASLSANLGDSKLDKVNDGLKNINNTIGNIGKSAKNSSGGVNSLNDALEKTGSKSKKTKATGKITSKGESILQAADMLGVSAVDLATLISYETSGSFRTDIKGPTITNPKSKAYGDHGLGLIQFMKFERGKYKVNANQSFDEQMGAVIKFLQDRGVKSGDDLMTMYKAVNGGNVNVSETKTDGYGTIRSHVGKMQRTHRKNAIDKLFGGKVPIGAGRAAAKDPVDKFEVNPEIEKMKQLRSAQVDVIKTYQDMQFELAALGLSQKDFGMASLEEAQSSLDRLDKIKSAQKYLNGEYSKSVEKLEEMNAAVDGQLTPVKEFDLSVKRLADSLGVSTDQLADMNPQLEKTRENLIKIADKQLADKAAANLKDFVDSISEDILDLDTKIKTAGMTNTGQKRSIEARAQLDKILSSDKFKNASESDRDTVEGAFWARFLKENKVDAIEKAAAATELYNDKIKELNSSLFDVDKLTEQQRLEIELTTGSLKELTNQQKDQLRALQGQVDLIKKSEEAQSRIKAIASDFGSIFADTFTDLFDRGVMGALETLGKGLKSFFKNLMMQIVGGIASQIQSSITNMLMKVLTGKSQSTQTGSNTGIGGVLQASSGMVIQNLQGNGQSGSGAGGGGSINQVMNNLLPNLSNNSGNSISSLGNNVITNSLSGGMRNLGDGHVNANGAVGSAISQSGKFSFASLGKSFGQMAPMLGMSLGQGLGGQSMGGQILGAIGGTVGGLALGIGTGAIGASGGVMGGMVAALGGAMSATAILAPIAGVLLLGAYLLGRNKKRRAEETQRNQLMVDAFSAMDKLISGVNNNSIDGNSAISQAEDIRSQYLSEANKLKDKKTKSHALQDVSRIDAKIATLKAAVSAQESRKANLMSLVPTFKNGGQFKRFADGGSTSDFINGNYQANPLGYITGAGTERSDSILARVSNKEYILDAATTKNIGVKKLDLLRKYKGLNLSSIPRFADGGDFGVENNLNITDTNFMSSRNSGQSEIKVGVEIHNNITQTEDGFLISTEAYLNTPQGRNKIDNIVAQNILEGRAGGKIINALGAAKK